jgi:hypothetical protein
MFNNTSTTIFRTPFTWLILLVMMAGCRKEPNVPVKLPSEGQPVGTLQVFPVNNPWNTDISNADTDPNSDQLIASIGNDIHLHPDFGTVWDNSPIGIPFNLTGASQPLLPVTFRYNLESDAGPYPVPPDAIIESGSDRHILIIDTTGLLLYELYNAVHSRNGWTAGSGAIFDLTSNKLRPDYWTSADAAGLPIFPGLVRYEEVVEKGEINHALRFTVSDTRNAFVHPATHAASDKTGAGFPPMGMRVRLKAGFNITGFSPHVQVILTALKKYGMFVADNGSDWYISGAPDSRWNDDELGELKSVAGVNFEVVKMGEVIPMPE